MNKYGKFTVDLEVSIFAQHENAIIQILSEPYEKGTEEYEKGIPYYSIISVLFMGRNITRLLTQTSMNYILNESLSRLNND